MFSLSTFVSVLALAPSVLGFTDYANDFVNPDYVLAKTFNTSTAGAQATIVQWANDLASQGPWSERRVLFSPPTDADPYYQAL